MYQIWHKNELIIDGANVIVPKKMPFGLRHYENLSERDVERWVEYRVNNLHRTYMNIYYKFRGVARTPYSVVNDSGGISITDFFWIQTKSTRHTWDNLQILRDAILGLAEITLLGKINVDSKYKKSPTSQFSIKGVHPKGIYNGYILKKGNFAEREYVGSKIAEILEIPSQEVEQRDEEVFALKIFTNENLSLVHAFEYLLPLEAEDLSQKIALQKFEGTEIESQLERLFIFNYIISNHDLHGENFGFMYDTETFEITKVSQAYDFNMAFEVGFNYEDMEPFISKNINKFLANHMYLIEKFNLIREYLKCDTYLIEEEKQQILNRISLLKYVLL